MVCLSRIGPPAVLLAALLAVTGAASAADLSGNWKLKDVSDTTLALLQFETKDGKPSAQSLGAPIFQDQASVEDLRIDNATVAFALKVAGGRVLKLTLLRPKGVENPERLKGVIEFNGRYIPAELEKTDAKAITMADVRGSGPAATALAKANSTPDAKEKIAALKEILQKHPDSAAAYNASQTLVQQLVKEPAKDEELRTAVQDYLRLGASYGPAVAREALQTVAQTLVRAEKVSPLAVEYARQLEKGLAKDAPPAVQAAALKTVVAALRKTGKADEAKPLADRLVKLEDQLDAEFRQTAVPFKPESYAGRKAKSNRVAVVELFTGAQCPPCVSADIAFDAALSTYAPSDVVFLQYHLHIPGPDPLTNADSEGRQQFYGKDVRGTPTVFVNGKVTPPLGGFKQHGKERYEALRKIVDDALETDGQGSLKLNVRRQGDQIDVKADVADLKKTGDNVKLHFVLVEDVARYAGSNGQRLHHHVVRAFPGGVGGMALKDASSSQAVTVKLADLAKKLDSYLTTAGKTRPFRDDDRPLDLKHLKVVALIQDDDSKEILQAAQADVPEDK